MSIRPACENDLPTLLEFEQEIIKLERSFDSTLKSGAVHYYDLKQLLVSPTSEIVVVEIDNEVVGSGYAMIKEADLFLEHSHFVYLGFMYVKLTHRGKGINQAILENLKEWAIDKGIHEIRLAVYEENSVAKKAYEKAGFKAHMLEMRIKI
jgi:GNAT superfamily N-acetyltransferase